MKPIFAKVSTEIWGTANSWSLAPHEGAAANGVVCDVLLEIQGNDKDGFHLVMSPEGFFAADNWYESKQDALASAQELFGTDPGDWSER